MVKRLTYFGTTNRGAVIMLVTFLIGVVIALAVHLYLVHKRLTIVERDFAALQRALITSAERMSKR